MDKASLFLVGAFAALALLVASAFPLGLWWAERRSGAAPAVARRAAGLAALATALWLGGTGVAAARGALTFDGRPPSMVLALAAMFAIAAGVSSSRAGERLALHLPLSVLVGIQSFRLPLELLMHRAYEEGLMPVQMSYSGLNFDILTGASAVVVAALLAAGRMPLWGVRLWNASGALLLANIVTVAILSAPLPMRVFTDGPANVWITRPPFVWLPMVMVLAAIVGHVVIARRLRAEARWRVRAAVGAGARQSPAGAGV